VLSSVLHQIRRATPLSAARQSLNQMAQLSRTDRSLSRHGASSSCFPAWHFPNTDCRSLSLPDSVAMIPSHEAAQLCAGADVAGAVDCAGAVVVVATGGLHIEQGPYRADASASDISILLLANERHSADPSRLSRNVDAPRPYEAQQ
jgi:hypothetical protein